MTLQKILRFIILFSLFACNPNLKETKTNDTLGNTKKPFFLIGDWVYHDNARFELIEIKDTNDVIYYTYINRKKETGIEVKDCFYKSEAKISVYNAKDSWLEKCGLFVFELEDRVISIQTDKYRFDYVVKKDTLIEFDKMGIRKRFFRLYLEKD